MAGTMIDSTKNYIEDVLTEIINRSEIMIMATTDHRIISLMLKTIITAAKISKWLVKRQKSIS